MSIAARFTGGTMLILDADMRGVIALADALESLQDVSAEQRSVLRLMQDGAVRIYQRSTPVGRGERPGRLKAAYTTTGPQATATSGAAGVQNTTPYLQWVLGGRGAVHARPGKVLRFVIDGRVFFRQSVGPAKANPFDAKAEAEIDAGAGQYAEQFAALVARKLA